MLDFAVGLSVAKCNAQSWKYGLDLYKCQQRLCGCCWIVSLLFATLEMTLFDRGISSIESRI